MNKLGDVIRGDKIGKRSKEWFVWTGCPNCGLERWVRRGKTELKNYTGWCQTCNARRNNKMRAYKTEEESLAWKGGHTKDHGYILVLLQPDDFFYPMANNKGYVREHRLVMAKYLNRCLLSWEVVHHKNGVKDDNRLENLKLFPHNREQQPDMQLKARIKQLEQQLLNERKAGIREVMEWLRQYSIHGSKMPLATVIDDLETHSPYGKPKSRNGEVEL